MVHPVDDLVVWKDFPKGLKVLLLDKDESSAAETKSKLEVMDYNVSLYCNEEDALEAISKEAESFHVAIVEVTNSDGCESFRFLETAQHIPTIAISNTHYLSTSVKCIALGAAEFLQKPLYEEKLRNIWQHVVHKAFNAGSSSMITKSLKPIKDTVVSMLQNQHETDEHKSEDKGTEKNDKYGCEETMSSDRLSAPSTPQLTRGGGRLLPNAEFQEVADFSITKQTLSVPMNYTSSISKSVENTSDNSNSIANTKNRLPSKAEDISAEEEVNSVDGSKTDECSPVKEGSVPASSLHNADNSESDADGLQKNISVLKSSSLNCARNNRKKIKVDWTPELHRQFVKAVEQLGLEQAIPSKILELMKVEGLTRHNVASHLQKYRMHKRHILPKDEDRRWQPHQYPTQRGCMPRPILAYPSFHPNFGAPANQIYPVWGHPSYHLTAHGVQMWSHASYTSWHTPSQSWPCKAYPMVHADAWGCPVVGQYGQYLNSSPRSVMGSDFDSSGERNTEFKDSCELHACKTTEVREMDEAIDEAVKEAMSKPWLPLPLGLKSPSTDVVLAELQRQGICAIPTAAAAAATFATTSGA